MSLLDTVEAKLLSLLDPVIRPIKGLWNLITKGINAITEIKDTIEATATTFTNLTNSLRHFQATPHFKHRVISAPRAIENVKQLTQVPFDIVEKIKDLAKIFKSKIGTEVPKPSEIAAETEGVDELGASIRKLGPKVSQAFEKGLGWFALILDAIESVNQTFKDVNAILLDLQEVVDDLSNLDGLFLPQKNPRKTVDTADGKMRIRVGNLHR